MEPRKAAEAASLSRRIARGVIQYCTERLHKTRAHEGEYFFCTTVSRSALCQTAPGFTKNFANLAIRAFPMNLLAPICTAGKVRASRKACCSSSK